MALFVDPALCPWWLGEMNRVLRKAVVAGIAVGLIPGTPTAAHQPWFNSGSSNPEEPYILRTSLDVSQVIYGGFTGPAQVDFYGFTAEEGTPVDINLVADDDDACADFRPAFVVQGPGIEASESPSAPALPAVVPPPAARDEAAIVHGGEWDEFYERFAGVTFVRGPAFMATLAGGGYLVAVFDPAGGAGVYGLTFGGAEVRGGDPEFFARFGPWSKRQPVRGADPWDPIAIG